MTGLDTNVLLRFMLQDEPEQSARAERIIRRTCTEDNPGYISLVTLAEFAWVLDGVYRLPSSEISDAIEAMLQADSLLLQHQDEVFSAAAALRSGGSFADALIHALGRWAGCTTTLTLDVKASRLPGFTLI